MAKSTADAAKFFEDQGDKEVEKLFWSQFNAPARPLPLSDKMAAAAELHMLSGLAMQSVIDHLWPKEPKPDSYFGLVQQFLGDVPQINAMRRSVCIEGAQMALARVKAYWTDMEATIVATQNPAGGQDPAEHYLEQVTEGALLIEASARRMSCSSDKSNHCKDNVILITRLYLYFLPESIIVSPVRPFMYICI